MSLLADMAAPQVRATELVRGLAALISDLTAYEARFSTPLVVNGAVDGAKADLITGLKNAVVALDFIRQAVAVKIWQDTAGAGG